MAHPSTYFLQTHFFQFLQALFYPLSFFSLVSLIFPGTFSCQPPNIFKSSPPKTIFPPNLKALLATTAFSSSLYRKALHLSPSVFHSHFSSDHVIYFLSPILYLTCSLRSTVISSFSHPVDSSHATWSILFC